MIARIILYLIASSLPLLLGSCAVFDTSPNIRIFNKGAIKLEAVIRGKSVDKESIPEYFHVTIGDPYMPKHLTPIVLPDIYIEMDEGNRILLSEMTPEYLFTQGSEPYELSPLSAWPEGAFSVVLSNKEKSQAYYFVATRDFILRFRATRFEYGDSVLWNKEQTKRYVFPLSQQDAVELFGEPNTVVDILRY